MVVKSSLMLYNINIMLRSIFCHVQLKKILQRGSWWCLLFYWQDSVFRKIILLNSVSFIPKCEEILKMCWNQRAREVCDDRNVSCSLDKINLHFRQNNEIYMWELRSNTDVLTLWHKVSSNNNNNNNNKSSSLKKSLAVVSNLLFYFNNKSDTPGAFFTLCFIQKQGHSSHLR